MRILHVLFSPLQGGLEEAFVNTTLALASHGHQVSVLTHPNAPYREALIKEGFTVHTARPRGFHDLFSTWKIRKLVWKTLPDVIIAHNGRAVSVMVKAAQGTGIRVCAVSHSYKSEHLHGADALIVLTEHMREHFAKEGCRPQKMHVLPNLMRLPDAMPQHPRHSPLVIGAIGRLVVEKGFKIFLEAISELKDRGLFFRVVIAGEGPERDSLERYTQAFGLESRITWLGWIADKQAFYQQVDMLCVPSLEESFGLVVLEGFAHGIPVVAANASGPASLITHGKNGLLAPVGSSTGLADGLAKLIEHQALGEKLAANAWERVQEYRFESVAKKWDETLRAIVSPAR